ncbi:hypothetical protein DKX38_023658 [Salix brachista]|uniref:Uncharacterized protein n=1 Tax=Salix brachista TaxID=2182728 RepID=A0A5N5JJD6_9ROSI|nr:hypothetical protein DKX38_023658 [Salix brachista]
MSETHLSEIRVDPLINKEEEPIQNNQPQELKMDETLGNNSSQNNKRSLWLDSIMNENDQPLLEKKIPRVPHKLRNENEECYCPLEVSIGPYHYPEPYDPVREVETLKVPMARQFILDSGKDIELIYSELQKVIQTAREFYDEDITRFDDEQFTQMMFLDGCFILQFMHCLINYESEKLEMSDRQIFHVKRDLLLLENQLPFAVLDSLRKQRYKNLSDSNEIINNFLSLHIRSSIKPIQKWVPIALTALGLFMIPILFPLFLLCFIIFVCNFGLSYQWLSPFRFSKNVSLDWSPPPEKTQPEHLLQLLYYKSMYHCSKRNHKKAQPGSRGHGLYYSAKKLKKAGIRFWPRLTGAITDVKFKPSLLSGKVEAPPIIIDESTESLLLNLVAYESAAALNQRLWVSSYILFMDSLIDDAEDVEEMRSNGIIINYLGADQKVADLFNGMGQSLTHDTAAYNDVKMAINKQCESTVKRWAYEWKKTYFSNPWTFITVLAASLGLCLTATQTYYTRFPPK